MFKRKCLLLLLLIVFMLVPASSVYAVSVSLGRQICYNTTTGVYEGDRACGHSTVYKTMNIGGQTVEAYCSQFNKTIGGCGDFKVVSGWSDKGRRALIGGKAVERAKETYKSNNSEAYLYASELLNYILKLADYKDFVSKNKDLKDIYDQAVAYVDKTAKYSGTEGFKISPAVKFTSGDNVGMNSTSASGTYISDQLTLGNLISNYGGGSGSHNGDVSYTIKVSGNGTAFVCTDAAGKTCKDGSSYSIPATDVAKKTYSFWVKITGVTDTSKDVTVNVTGSNSSTYPSTIAYQSTTKASTCQTVLNANDEVTFTRKTSTSLNLSIPDNTKYAINVRKVDEDGNAVSGASLSLYSAKDDDTNTKIADLQWSSTTSTVFKYSVSQASDNADFWNKKYCIKENTAPSGFVLRPAICQKFTSASTTTCYDVDGNSLAAKYCEGNWKCADGYTYNEQSGKCEMESNTPAATVYECPDEAHTRKSSADDLCLIDTVIDDATGEVSCSSGTVIDGKCYVAPSANFECTEGKLTGGQCVVVHQSDDVSCVDKSGNSLGDKKYCENKINYTLVTRSGNSVTINYVNKKTSVTISKKVASGEDEIPGARLRICTDKPDANGKCTVKTLTQQGLRCPSSSGGSDSAGADANLASCTNVGDNDRKVNLDWVSSTVPRTWEGLEVGTYYLVEDTPPAGYKSITTSIEFTINADGTVKSGTKEVPNGLVVVNNELTKMSVSKQDIATSKEVPGATISICESDKDENGNLTMVKNELGDCSVVALANGDLATWVSGNEPHNIDGLPAGTYFLVERIAPKGYGTAESIIFTMKPDGTLVDKDGKSLKDSKIIMHDKKIGDVKTGMFGVYFLIAVLLMSVVGGAGSYFFLKKKRINEV